MKAQKELERLEKLIPLLPEDIQKDVAIVAANRETWKETTPGAILGEWFKAIKAEIMTEEAKAIGKTNAKKAAENIMKQCTENGCECGAFIGEDERQIIGGTSSAVRLYSALPVAPWVADSKPFNYDQCVNAAADNVGERLTIPDRATLSAAMAEQKANFTGKKKEFRPVWDFGEGLPMVNALYLYDILQIIETDTTATAAAHRPETSAIYIKGYEGDGILLPVRKTTPGRV